ncbi:DUF2798 domain-containing protein [Acinetobacter sp. NIPH 1852]|uniref:DUF2798 domain-containing protein n=1 Tax=unclassified Acinetobacter TaxID=196816 RepID=UPI0002CF695A|nr:MULTISPECIES: DUF2798 domain-containing protein [unclassified Acinetobacter]MBP8005565.1 DUF2798 domain-containing protein [Acinetobacter sp.]MDR7017541.1 Zn-dependent protease with chaperone function [Prolinoborus sp. 3657]ENU31876.1 hypothetical protein F991_00195 [Acinetobacter sp. CIP-A165]ENW96881.1 hypothetical protein F903_00694 [Acinetobacter sp. NIPH 298]MCH7308868.1 DUF2798 domain-containing protein [Acinetobacter sp. NIPH 1852]
MKAATLLFPLILSCIMSFLISGITTLKALGFVENFFSMWMSAWMIAWMFAFPSVLVCAPIAQKLVSLILKNR